MATLVQAGNALYPPVKYAQEAGNMDMRAGSDRRKENPFGRNGPWLTTGKMGGLVITNRRKSAGRRTTDNQQGQVLSTSAG